MHGHTKKKNCTRNPNALNIFSESRAIYEIMWKNIVQSARPLMTIWSTRATNIHSDYVIIIACPLQQRLHERASMLRYTYSACLVEYSEIRIWANSIISVFYIMHLNPLFWEGVRRLHQTLKEIHDTRKVNKPRPSCFIPGKEPWYQLKQRLVGTQSWLGSFGQERNTLPLPWFKTRNLPVHGLITVPTELSQRRLHKEDF
jgi:hypothetical protein